MKSLHLFIIAVLLSPVCLLYAQDTERALYKVDIPFAFTIENQRLSSGSYIIYVVNPDHLWRISSSNHKLNAFFHIRTEPNGGLSETPKLVFHHYPTDYVLRQIDAGRAGFIASLNTGRRERELAAYSRPLEVATIAAETE